MLLSKRRQVFLAERDSTRDVRHVYADHRFSLLRGSASQTVYVYLHHFLLTPVSDYMSSIIDMRNPARHGPTDPGDKACDGAGFSPERRPYVPVERRRLVTIREENEARFAFGQVGSFDSRIESFGNFAACCPGHAPVDLLQDVRQRTIVLTYLNGCKHDERAMPRKNAESGLRTTGKIPEGCVDCVFREFESRRCAGIQFHIVDIHALRYIHDEQVSVGVLRNAKRGIGRRDTEKNESQDQPGPCRIAREFHGNGSLD